MNMARLHATKKSDGFFQRRNDTEFEAPALYRLKRGIRVQKGEFPVKCRQLVFSLMTLLTFSLFTSQSNAQSAQNPDFSNVNDILNGNRTLLNVTDLFVATVGLAPPNYGTDQTLVYQYPVNTSNSQQTNPPSPPDSWGTLGEGGGGSTRIFSGRMFNQAAATVVVAFSNGQLLVQNPSFNWTPGVDVYGNPVLPYTLPNGAMADFNQDGYDELALSYSDGTIVVASAAPPYFNLGPIAKLDALSDMVAGDFNGDGKLEIAGLSILPSGGLKLVIYSVDPTTLAITPASSLVLNTPGTSTSTPITHVSIARGKFNTLSHDQLVVTFATNSGNPYAEIIDFASSGSLTPTEQPQLNVSNTTIPAGYLQVKTGQFGLPANPYDQIVWHESSTAAGGRFFWVLQADQTTLALTTHGGITYDGYPCAAGIQVGNFDNQQPDPLNPAQNEHNPNAQIAFMYCNSDAATAATMNIYNVNPQTFDIVNPPASALFLPAGVTGLNSSFVAADLQGRSMALGEPTKVTIDNTKPTIINAAPPMHVDYVTPAGGTAPEVLNISFIPDGFNSSYDLSQQSSTGASTTHKMSWSAGVDESGSAGFEVGDVDAGSGVKYTAGFHAAQDFLGSTENGNNSFATSTFDVSATTKVGDIVFYDDSRLNIWVYPVIGQTACPAETPNCLDSQKKPLTVQFSGPDQIDTGITSTEDPGDFWYQPPWEVGNVFSYPATASQLALIYPDLAATQLSHDISFGTSPSSVKIQATWSKGTGVDKTTSTTDNFSFDVKSTFVVASGAEGIGDVSTKESVKVSGSYGFGGLQTNTAQVSGSNGIGILSTALFPDTGNYGYKVSPFILGGTPNTGVVNDSTQPPLADIQTEGPLKTAFAADPLDSQDGGHWWKTAYTLPDVALSHPHRWILSEPSLAGNIPLNCANNGLNASQMDCADIAPYYDAQGQPLNPWVSNFYSMRGFFITSPDNPGAGPQLGYATAGDKLDLAVRVYNDSLAEMPGGTVVHVRFYGMPWNNSNDTPAGDSFLIGETTLGSPGNNESPIPAFSDTSNTLNWALVHAPAPFDTTPYSNQFLTFWVVVWMEDSSGALVKEMPGHGLTSIPGTLKQPSDVQLEMAANTQGEKVSYSNNVGFYEYAFPVLPKETGLGAPPPGNPAETILKKVLAARKHVRLGELDEITADLTTQSVGKSSLKVYFYDGNPDKGGSLIGSEISWVEPNTVTTARIAYHPATDGVHHIWAVINRGKPYQMERETSAIIVGHTGHDGKDRDDDDGRNDDDHEKD
jgi:hypothetical protein